jgi:hypothetical protein
MQRRDIFNMFFLGISKEQSTNSDPEPVLDLSAYYKIEEKFPVNQELKTKPGEQQFELGINTAYPFTVTLDINEWASLAIVLQFKDNEPLENSMAEVGIKNNSLFIGETTDKRTLPTEALSEGFQLVLNITPQKEGITHVKLKAINKAGLTLAVLKSSLPNIALWKKNMKISTEQYNNVRIEGYRSL